MLCRPFVYDPDVNVLFCLFRDISREVKTEQEKLETSLQTIAIAGEVIKKQIRTVQETTLLLGEATASATRN